MGCFRNAQTARVDDGQGHAHNRLANHRKDGANLIDRQHHRQFFYRSGAHQIKDVPCPLEGGLIEELDAAQVNGDGTPGGLAVIDQVQEKAPHFLFSQ